MSGTGKSSALAELRTRGFQVVDTDEDGWTEWTDEDGGHVWREDPIAALLSREEGPTLYVSGTVSNQGRFYPQFDAVVLLSAPAEVLLRRIERRTTNPYGKTATTANRFSATWPRWSRCSAPPARTSSTPPSRRTPSSAGLSRSAAATMRARARAPLPRPAMSFAGARRLKR